MNDNTLISTRAFFTVAAATVLFSALVFFFPQIDLAIAGFFYRAPQRFLLENYYGPWHLSIFRDLLVWITYGLLAATAVMFLLGIFFKKIKMPWPPKTCLFLLICFAIGPVLLVNNTLKDHWGRARPYQVQAFGGDKIFTPAWVISKQCNKNCSFTSGETANVFCYLALLFIVRRKKLLFSVILTVGLLTSLERIAQGDHFFSDVILSGLLDYLVIWIIYFAMENKFIAEINNSGIREGVGVN